MLKSSICKQEDLESSAFQKIEDELKTREWLALHNTNRYKYDPSTILHRKSWEFSYITLALQERGMLQEGKKGLGFAVGEEPLPAFYASRGCEILATDLGMASREAKRWAQTGQNAAGDIGCLNALCLCPDELFQRNVRYRDIDMNDIPEDLDGKFDFCWSSCAIEHVGSLEKSKQFLKNMLKTLRPGGVAIHTTEFNLSSNISTVEFGNSVIYRRKDILEIEAYMSQHGHKMELDFSLGSKEGDLFVDTYPYYASPPLQYHLRLRQYPNRYCKILYYLCGRGILNRLGWDCTSIGLIIHKGD